MATAHLGLDVSPVQSAQTNVFFSDRPQLRLLLPCHNVKILWLNFVRTLTSMAEVDPIWVSCAPEIEQAVAALVVSPDEAL